MLYAIGLGQGAIPVAAAINWVLKDGLGQFGGILFASVVNQRFDAEPRRWRFQSACLLDAAIMIEVITPWFPAQFLVLASLANIGKNVGWMSTSASRAGIHRAFMRAENLGDITGKAASQSIAASVIGTGIGVVASSFLGHETHLIVGTALGLSVVHLALTKKSIDPIVVRTMSLQRFWLAVRNSIRYTSEDGLEKATGLQLDLAGLLPPDQVAKQERYVHFGNLAAREHGKTRLEQSVEVMSTLSENRTVGLRVGSELNKAFASVASLEAALSSSKQRQDKHVLAVKSSPNDATVHVLFFVDSTDEDILKGMLHAFLTHQALLIRDIVHDDSKVIEYARNLITDEYFRAMLQTLEAQEWETDHLFFEASRARIQTA